MGTIQARFVETWTRRLVWELQPRAQSRVMATARGGGDVRLQMTSWLARPTPDRMILADAGVKAVHGMAAGADRMGNERVEVYATLAGNVETARAAFRRVMDLNDKRAIRVVDTPGFRAQVAAGDQGQHYLAGTAYGTVGGFVEDDENVYALSNYHVFSLGNARAQKENLNSPVRTAFGGLERDVRLGVPPALNSVDAAIGWILSDQKVESPHFAHPMQHAVAQRGMKVTKWGASTGPTTGRVTALAGTAVIHFSGLGSLNFHRLIRIEGDAGAPFTMPGDSGSMVVSQDGNMAIGLHFAGDASKISLACRMEEVLATLGVRISHVDHV